MDKPYVGEIRLMAATTVPDGWAACDGQLLAIAQYRPLYDVLGTTYGGNGHTTFALPDLRGRVIIQATGDLHLLGTTGGEAAHQLTVEEMPAHRHRMPTSNSSAISSSKGDPRPVTVSGVAYAPATEIEPLYTPENIEAPAAGHNNMQPYLGLQFLIALVGREPSDS